MPRVGPRESAVTPPAVGIPFPLTPLHQEVRLMSRVLLIGYGPLPKRGIRHYSGSALRTRQILSGVLEEKHDVHVFTLPVHGAEDHAGGSPAVVEDEWNGLKYSRFTSHSGEFAVSHLNEIVRRLRPCAIVGVSTYASYIASMLATTTPLWCDLNAPWMAQMQAKCHAEGDDKHLIGAWNIERAILRRLDKFSAVSRPHLHALIGALSTVGRLNRHTFHYFFGSPIPNSFYDWGDILTPEEKSSDEKVLRGRILPHSAFVILWSGSIRPSSDVETLVRAMTRLMDRYEEVHLVVTGGAAMASESYSVDLLERAVAGSPHKDRMHLLGWVEAQELPAIYREADLGINIDSAGYETLFAGRARINIMAAAGLPFLTTLGTEISEWIEDAHAALIAQLQNPDSILDAIEPWIDQREKLRDYSRRAKRMLEADFTDAQTTRALRVWLAQPENAPDNAVKIKRGGAELEYLASIAINPIEEALLRMDALASSEPALNSGPESPSTAPQKSILGKLKNILGG